MLSSRRAGSAVFRWGNQDCVSCRGLLLCLQVTAISGLLRGTRDFPSTRTSVELPWIPSCRWAAPWSSSPVACPENPPKPREGRRGRCAGAASAAGGASAGGEVFPAAARRCQTRGSESTRTSWRERGKSGVKTVVCAVVHADLKAVDEGSCLTMCLLLKETAASCAGQEECGEGGEKDPFQEPPLSAEGTPPCSRRHLYTCWWQSSILPSFVLGQATPARKPAPAKEDSFFGAFQGLSLEGLMGSGSPAAAASAAPGDPCKVMWDVMPRTVRHSQAWGFEACVDVVHAVLQTNFVLNNYTCKSFISSCCSFFSCVNTLKCKKSKECIQQSGVVIHSI